MDCVFCAIRDGTVPAVKVFEDDKTLVFMDINPLNDGHMLVIPKRHSANIFEIPEDDLAAVALVAKRMAAAAARALRPDGLNLLQANGPAAGQSVEHFHVHVIPRWMADGKGFDWVLVRGDIDRIKDVAERIKAEL